MPSKRPLDRRTWWPIHEPRSRGIGSSSGADGQQSSPTSGRSFRHRPAFCPDRFATTLVFRRIHKLHESLRAVLHDARHLLAVFAVFAADYQRSTSRSPRKSWAADGLANSRTAAAPAVLSLFSAVLVRENPRNAKRSPPQENRFIALPHICNISRKRGDCQYHKCLLAPP